MDCFIATAGKSVEGEAWREKTLEGLQGLSHKKRGTLGHLPLGLCELEQISKHMHGGLHVIEISGPSLASNRARLGARAGPRLGQRSVRARSERKMGYNFWPKPDINSLGPSLKPNSKPARSELML